MNNGDVISMPDKWEYPWYAAWDLAFHVLALTLVDPDFGKKQLKLMLRERYMHPNGQIPAYEWNFGDVNPPVHAWSTIFTYRLEKAAEGEADKEWLKCSFQKLLLNFTWWVNRKDRSGRNVFEGGFLGLDNIGVFDRNAPLPTGGYLEQADGTAWMALFCQNMLEIAAELALTDPDYGEMALKFLEHFLWIASSMSHLGEDTGMWDDEDGFFYDVLRMPDGQSQRLKVRSMVGLLPFCAATTFEGETIARFPELGERFQWFLDSRPEVYATIHDPRKTGVAGRRLASILDKTKLRRVLSKMLDEQEFLSPYGLRSLSRYHADHPYIIHAGGQRAGRGSSLGSCTCSPLSLLNRLSRPEKSPTSRTSCRQQQCDRSLFTGSEKSMLGGFLESLTQLPLLARFAVAMSVILVVPTLCQKVRLPSVVGLLLAGVLFGPHGLHVGPKSHEVAHFFADIGKLLLMFFAGLEIDLVQFRSTGRRSLVFGLATFAMPLAAGFLAGLGFGYGWLTALLIGSLLASHTLLGYPIIQRLGLTRDEAVTVTVGATIFTDVASLMILAVCIPIHVAGFSMSAFLLQLAQLAVYVPLVVFGLGALIQRLIDEPVLNSVIVLMVVTSILGPILTDQFGKRLTGAPKTSLLATSEVSAAAVSA
jgi:Sodium/hydrogen exchanger family